MCTNWKRQNWKTLSRKVRYFVKLTKRHPGGAEWIEMTEGQDITEAFEAAHIRGHLADAIAKKYFVKKIVKPRNSVTTFEETGWLKQNF